MSKIEVNQISSQCGSTLTIGQSGDTVTLASGATQSGFGRTGSVNWDTTAKTTNFTAVSGNGYFVNTTSGAITVTLPASPSAGDIVAIADYARTFSTNNVTVGRNSSLIQGVAIDATINQDGRSVTFVYVDGTKGWVPTEDQSTTNYGFAPIVATGGTVTTCGDYKIHTFTSPGTFCVSCAGSVSTVDYLVVAGGGGGGGGSDAAGAGGGGGFRESSGAASGCYTTSPLGSCVSALPVSATGYPITIGGGGAGYPTATSPADSRGATGSNSVFSTITSTGGGGGGGGPGGIPTCYSSGKPGGAGGGAATTGGGPGTVGAGNTPPVSPPQGQPGGTGASDNASYRVGGGGGGATTQGEDKTNPVGPGVPAGDGGTGATTSISASSTAYSGGGGGGGHVTGPRPGGTGGTGGGGNGSIPGAAGSGTTNRGGGGGGGGPSQAGASGGSGIVIIRYKYQ